MSAKSTAPRCPKCNAPTKEHCPHSDRRVVGSCPWRVCSSFSCGTVFETVRGWWMGQSKADSVGPA